MASGGTQTFRNPYYDPAVKPEHFDGYYTLGKFAVSEPGSKAGEAILAHDGLNASAPRGLWQYLVGQRRVRKAPSVGYDTPDAVTSGIGLCSTKPSISSAPSTSTSSSWWARRRCTSPTTTTARPMPRWPSW